jgi:hypothetical protein
MCSDLIPGGIAVGARLLSLKDPEGGVCESHAWSAQAGLRAARYAPSDLILAPSHLCFFLPRGVHESLARLIDMCARVGRRPMPADFIRGSGRGAGLVFLYLFQIPRAEFANRTRVGGRAQAQAGLRALIYPDVIPAPGVGVRLPKISRVDFADRTRVVLGAAGLRAAICAVVLLLPADSSCFLPRPRGWSS